MDQILRIYIPAGARFFPSQRRNKCACGLLSLPAYQFLLVSIRRWASAAELRKWTYKSAKPPSLDAADVFVPPLVQCLIHSNNTAADPLTILPFTRTTLQDNSIFSPTNFSNTARMSSSQPIFANLTEPEIEELNKQIQTGCYAYTDLLEPSYGYIPSFAGGLVLSILFAIPFFYHTFRSVQLRKATSILLALGALSESPP